MVQPNRAALYAGPRAFGGNSDASRLPDIGADLTEELATEWAQRYPQDAQGLRSPSGRIFFLKQLALFSSESSKRLGLPSIRQAQLEALGVA